MSSEPGLWAEIAGTIAFNFSKIQPMLLTELHVILASLFPIVSAAHASLSRPSSAAKPKPRTHKTAGEIGEEEDSEDEEEDTVQHLEGLSRSDALYMPLFAGITLTGLYFLIKWLKDLDLLNKILNYYFSAMGVFSVCKLLADAMDYGHSFLFPKWYVDSRGYWHVNSTKRKMALVKSGVGETIVEERGSPLPGPVRRIPVPVSVNNFLWTLRELPSHKITFKFYIHHIVAVRTHLTASTIFGVFLGLIATGYYIFVEKTWWLTNLMGFAFSYTALQILSPTTFDTGSLILCALFVYDIVMVFYTPMMVTVATKLDVPIKLLIPRPPDKDGKARFSMLGLGDIVIPGMMVGLALRFDLYLHYLRQQKTIKTDDGATHTFTARYIAPGKHAWTRFWTSPWASTPGPRPASLQTGSFRKTYFWASVIGYTLGMITTLWVMVIFNHAQPALLWLVPSVLGSLWGTAMVRGELKLMWDFTEATEEATSETVDKEKEKNKKGESKTKNNNPSIFSMDREPKLMKAMEKVVQEGESASEGEGEDKRITSQKKVEKLENKFCRDKANDLFYFSIGHYSPLQAKSGKEKSPKWRADEVEGERSGKRLRVA